VFVLPAVYLADGDVPEDGGSSFLALSRRVADVLVPKAMAHGRP
jgi:hypothetical protein